MDFNYIYICTGKNDEKYTKMLTLAVFKLGSNR